MTIALSVAASAAGAFGPTYDGPVGDPGFPPPRWMLQKFCASGDTFDFCQAYTIEEQRRMMMLYKASLGAMVDDDCDTAQLDFSALRDQAKAWWPSVSDPPYGIAFDFELIDPAQGAAFQRYKELRAEHPGDQFCTAIFEEPELKGLLGRCVKEAEHSRICYGAGEPPPKGSN